MLLVIILLLIGYIIWNSRTAAQKRPIVQRAEQVSDSLRNIGERVPTPFTKRDKKRREQLTAWLRTNYLESDVEDVEAQALAEWLKGLSDREFTAFLQRIITLTESLGVKLDAALKDNSPATNDVLRLGALTAWKSSSIKTAA